MITYLLVPGLGGSGPAHWQTLLENSNSNFIRVQQQRWDAPECSQWVANLQYAVSQYDSDSIVLIAHSLGCITVAHWAAKFNTKIKGALLVAPSDVEFVGDDFPATGFSPVPLQKLPFKTIVVASENDPWVTLERAQFFAGNWGGELINIGQAGHINAEAGYGEWEQGFELLKKFE